MAIQGVGIITNIKENFGNGGRLQDRFERLSVAAIGGESLMAKNVDVNKVDVILRNNE